MNDVSLKHRFFSSAVEWVHTKAPLPLTNANGMRGGERLAYQTKRDMNSVREYHSAYTSFILVNKHCYLILSCDFLPFTQRRNAITEANVLIPIPNKSPLGIYLNCTSCSPG